MATTHIDIPDELHEQINERSTQQGYSGPEEYVRALIREDLKRAAQQRLKALIQEGLDSGDPVEVTPEFWGELKKRCEKVARERHGTRKDG